MQVVWGTEDTWIPVDRAHRLAGLVPGARLDLVQDAGHLVQLDAPERLTEILRRWLAARARRSPERVAADQPEQPRLGVGVVGDRTRGPYCPDAASMSASGSIPASMSAHASGSRRSSRPAPRARSQVCMKTSEV